MKTAFTGIILFILLAGCIAVQWVPNSAPQQQAQPTLDKILLLKSFALPVIFIIICGVPFWILVSTWRVKRAIDKAHEPDYDGIRHWLRLNGTPLYPSRRYDEIVQLLRQLYTTPSDKPEVKASRYSQYFITRGQGYFLTLEGRGKMLDHINSGFLSAKFMDDYEPKDIGKLVGKIVLIAVLIRFGALLIGGVAHWFTGH